MVQRKLKLALIAAAAAVGVWAAPNSASAGSKDLSQYGWFASFDDGLDLTVLNTGPGGLVLSLQKFAQFDDGPTATGVIQPLSIVFRQVSPSAVPTIAIEAETVINDTGIGWIGFRFILEGGTGTLPTFDLSRSSDFDVEPFDVEDFSDRELRVSSETASIPSGSFPANVYTPGVDDSGATDGGALWINTSPLASGNQTFVFKEQPILIPLPTAAWTGLSGLLGLGTIAYARRFRQMLA